MSHCRLPRSNTWRPTVSSWETWKVSRKAVFTACTFRLPSSTMNGSRSVAMMFSAYSSASCARSSARRCSLMSRKTTTTPATAPASSRIGAAASSIRRSVPFFATSSVSASAPSRGVPRARLSTGWRVVPLTMLKTFLIGRPRASSCSQPVSDSAIAFRKVTRPSRFAVMTPSPMFASATRIQSGCAVSWGGTAIAADEPFVPLTVLAMAPPLLIERGPATKKGARDPFAIPSRLRLESRSPLVKVAR